MVLRRAAAKARHHSKYLAWWCTGRGAHRMLHAEVAPVGLRVLPTSAGKQTPGGAGMRVVVS